MEKEIIIVVLGIALVYLYYQQNNQPNLLGNSEEKIKNLQQKAQHYQTLYQKRVEKDLGYSQLSQKTQTEDLSILTNQDKEILQKVQEFCTLIEKTDSNSINRDKMNEIEALADQINQPQVKAIVNQVVTDLAYVLGHRSMLKKLEEKETELDRAKQGFNEQLRKINILFDEKATNYETIDFSGLYSLLEKVKQREREREQK